MGLADLTGELMRNAINSLATGNTEVWSAHPFYSAHPSSPQPRCVSLCWRFFRQWLKPLTSWREKRHQGTLGARFSPIAVKVHLESNSYQGSGAEAKHEEGGAGLLLHPGQGLGDSQGWSNITVRTLN